MRKYSDASSEKFAGFAQETGKPIIGTTLFNRKEDHAIKNLQDIGVPFLPSPERAASAMNALYRYGIIRKRLETEHSAI